MTDAEIRARLAALPPMTAEQIARQRTSFARGMVALDEIESTAVAGEIPWRTMTTPRSQR